MAQTAELDQRVLATAGGVWKGKVSARRKVAREIQRPRPYQVVWPNIQPRGPDFHGFFESEISHGIWGLAPFQSMHRAANPNSWLIAAATPEWCFLIAIFASASLLGFIWRPLWLLSIPMFVYALALPLIDAAINSTKALIRPPYDSKRKRAGLWGATFLLSMIEPVARLYGRLRHGLTPWRARFAYDFSKPWANSVAFWSEIYRVPEQWLALLRDTILRGGGTVINGGEYDRSELSSGRAFLAGLGSLWLSRIMVQGINMSAR